LISDEVRNPLSSALSAFSFVESAVKEDPPLSTEAKGISVREDLSVIGSSLKYINDLLRNMLDMHKIASNELHVELSPTNLRHDVLDTVQGLLYNRGENVKVEVICPENLAVMTDRIRLKQIILNLTSNSRKFVLKGFIRVRVAIVDEKVTIYVEDSGPGIPESKQKQLWNKYQESLDALNQGTGIGLSLCKDLILLMNGNIWLDSQYNSGVPGCPGACFVINLNAPPLDLTKVDYHLYDESEKNFLTDSLLPHLPAKMDVLFVDDDFILRRLFGRSIKRILPQWKIYEAASGEKAIEMAKIQKFDLIFVDHVSLCVAQGGLKQLFCRVQLSFLLYLSLFSIVKYMASIEKQLLGTETVRELRANGVESVICGLSANNVEESFLEAGSNQFMFKPFPCEKNELAQELVRILKGTKYLSMTRDD
jgi:CheY-like chemotaxis protein